MSEDNHKYTTVCPKCHEEDFVVSINSAGEGFNGEYTQHWFEGDGKCGSCGHEGWISESD